MIAQKRRVLTEETSPKKKKYAKEKSTGKSGAFLQSLFTRLQAHTKKFAHQKLKKRTGLMKRMVKWSFSQHPCSDIEEG